MDLRPKRQTLRTYATRLRAAALCVLALCAPAFAQDGASNEGDATRRPMINVKPLQDVAAKAKELLEQGQLGPDARVDVTARGQLNDDGTLKPETVVLDWQTGSDGAVASLAQHFVLALSQSKIFGILEGAKEVTIRLRLDEANAFFSFASDLPSAESAAKLSQDYDAMLRLAAVSKEGTRAGKLYKSLKIASDGKRLAFTFEMQREELNRVVTGVSAKQDARAGG